MRSRKKKAVVLRKQWPRVREVVIKGKIFYVVDPRPDLKRETFTDPELAKSRAHQIALERNRFGLEAVSMDVRERADFMRAKEILEPHGVGFMAAAEHYAAHLERQKAIQGSLSIADALDQWSGSYRLKSRSRRTLSEIESYAGRFKNGFHGMKLGELDKISLHSFLENYLTDTGKPPTDQTRVNLRTKLGQFCEFCRLKGWMEQNPIQNVPITRPKNGRVEILAIGKAAALMEAASQKDPATGMVPYFAVCLFAGLRPEEAKGPKWEDIDLAQKQIFVRAETSKTRQDRYVTIEDNLWQWLTASRRKKGPIVGPNYRRNFDSVREQAGFWIWRRTKKQNSKDAPRWTDDIMRHSYASYWLAVHHDRAKLAEQMGNSLAVIRQHYRKAILQSEGKSYWTILPS